ncbi:AraC-like DNA-binding protein [Paenibacillus phyllosphaerae]|uniref:AraC-like DNA-binding protein n=1 Tax=Paenibacillus phyllosphaerae TaxID=274593 RepID=A0A7W5FQ44_9BACL|nr:AraC family transcriptional regulator [Paenibacillus phyllosphaerae]MBB3112842.1 AraC-like DNA-binding protein [Paenibacillus phyllosphaerae]
MTFIANFGLTDMPLYFAYKRTSTSETEFQGTFHAHQGVEILIVHEGKGTLIIDQRSYELQPGLVCVFQPYQLHHIQVELSENTPFIRTIIHYEPARYESFLDQWPALQGFFKHIHKGKLPAHIWHEAELAPLSFLLRDLDERLPGLSKDQYMEESSLFIVSFFRAFKQLWDKQHKGAAGKQELRKPHQAERILEWLEGHYKEPLRLELMSKDLHLSTYHLSHLFRECTGSSISDYLTAKRMQQAVLLLLSTDKAVSLIAEEVGVVSTSYFCKVFKDYFGLPPYRYRKQWRDRNLLEG